MIALEVSLNGQFITLAGRDDLCVLNTIIDAVGVLGRDSGGTKTKKADFDLKFSVGGLAASSEEDPGEHVRWVQSRRLKIGDLIEVRVLESNTADKPIKVKKASNQQNKNAIGRQPVISISNTEKILRRTPANKSAQADALKHAAGF